MQRANTLQVRAAINKAFLIVDEKKTQTWTDPVKWSDFSSRERVVTYRAYDAAGIADEANKILRAQGFNNEVRWTDGESLPCGSIGYGPYVRCNAYLP